MCCGRAACLFLHCFDVIQQDAFVAFGIYLFINLTQHASGSITKEVRFQYFVPL